MKQLLPLTVRALPVESRRRATLLTLEWLLFVLLIGCIWIAIGTAVRLAWPAEGLAITPLDAGIVVAMTFGGISVHLFSRVYMPYLRWMRPDLGGQ